MSSPRFTTYGFYIYLFTSIGFFLAAIIVAKPTIESLINSESATGLSDQALSKALVLSAISIYLAIRSYFYYRLKQRTNHESGGTNY